MRDNLISIVIMIVSFFVFRGIFRKFRVKERINKKIKLDTSFKVLNFNAIVIIVLFLVGMLISSLLGVSLEGPYRVYSSILLGLLVTNQQELEIKNEKKKGNNINRK
jgi:Na+/H+ antiporter NhaD/arsenite permease-like protein